jgi:hypothetical protein
MYLTQGVCYHTGYKPIFRQDVIAIVDELLDNLNKDFAEGWRPNEGDTIVGKVTDVSKGWSDQSSSWYPIVTVDDENSNTEKAIHCFHHVLKNKMVELQPKIGERIAVRFTGEVPTKDGKRTVKTYKVSIEGRDSSASVWDSVAKDPAVVAAEEAVKQKEEDDLPF